MQLELGWRNIFPTARFLNCASNFYDCMSKTLVHALLLGDSEPVVRDV